MASTTGTATIAGSGPVIPGVGTSSGSTWNPSTGPIGAARTSDHQYSFSGVGPYPGVTGILDVIHKEALSHWRGNTVARIAVEQFDQLGLMIAAKGSETAIEWLRGLPGYQRDSAAKIGTAVHHLADLLGRDRKPLEGFGITEQALPYAQAFQRFLVDYRGSENIVSSEKMVIHFDEAYGGQYDLLLTVNGELWLVDIKTSKGLYPETGLQLVAYGMAQYIMLPNDPTLYPMPTIKRYGVLHLRPDQYEKGYRFVEYQVRDVDYQAFLAARNLWEWRKEGRFQQKNLSTVDSTTSED